MQYTPVIPPAPGTNGNSTRPPVIPSSPNPPLPAWAQQQQFPAVSPFVGAHPMAPGSYFIPPVALPGQASASPPIAPVGSSGFSPDWTGFPSRGSLAGSPYAAPQTPYAPSGAPPQTPYAPPGAAFAPFAAYPGMWNMMGAMGGMPMATPYGMPGMFPGMMGAWQTPFAGPGAGGLPPHAAPPSAAAPTPAPAPPPLPRYRPDASEFSQVDKFAEGLHYGPVLEPMLIKKVGAKVEINPLLAPPPDGNERDYLKWNMLFSTAQCQRALDPPNRSWSAGRHAPATWPRVTSLRLFSRSIPWPIEVDASDRAAGVTCGDVLEAISMYMNGRIAQRQYDFATDEQKRTLGEAFYHNRSTAHGVPGGRLPQTLLRFDWLGQSTMFGGIVADDNFVKEICGGLMPCVFELRCMYRYPMTEQEIEDQRRREEANEARTRRGRRSRATSRATSRRTTPPSEDNDPTE
ncbi:hypothetical protein WOLCODRAFT_161666 [Wolfiporia cocos MD-104 SS10]|uniref:DUF6699 domain-containing protein n=1 Tax=Wolfiporia cocos (strain MD-104) TaxID=742152 RepID=A0A2H3J8M7_WOLCO|nr:hypothetical protein WOLCODRAFT_161666 [Wolfiporia cocos MD-104 SS10]